MNHRNAGAGFYAQLAVLGIATYLVHEGAHWVAGAVLGYPVRFGFNNVSSLAPMIPSDAMMMSAAGPAVTILGALIAFVWARRTSSLTAYAILYFAFFMRTLAAVISLLNPNDEARVSAQLSLGMWTLPVFVVVGLGVLTMFASRTLRLSWTVNAGAFVVSSCVVTMMVGLDMVLQR